MSADQTEITVNTPLLAKVLDHIVAHPEEWNQGWWAQQTACGTAYCVAGHAVVMSGHDVAWGRETWSRAEELVDGRTIEDVAGELLGLPRSLSAIPYPIFDSFNSMRKIFTLANEYTGGEIAIPDELPDGS